MTSSIFLQRHGTQLVRLPATAVLAAARADIALRDEKRGMRKGADNRELDQGEADLNWTRFAFLADDVNAARNAADLLRLALENTEWSKSDKVNARVLYGDREMLEAALKLAEVPA